MGLEKEYAEKWEATAAQEGINQEGYDSQLVIKFNEIGYVVCNKIVILKILSGVSRHDDYYSLF